MWNIRRLLPALVLLLFVQAPTFATDLAKVDRSIAKEPAYRSKPKYCLLVFGQDAKHGVWLVQDGDTLYVDRNGNGDLTEPGNKIAAEKDESGRAGVSTFKLRELRVGGRVHRDLNVSTYKLEDWAASDKRAKAIVAKDPQARTYIVMLAVERPGWRGTGLDGRVQHRAQLADANGFLQFADRPQHAPIIHFDGPREITDGSTDSWTIGREKDIFLGVGSRGLGAGTHSWIDYDGVIPEKAYPTLEIVYPPLKPGDPPIREKHELKLRC